MKGIVINLLKDVQQLGVDANNIVRNNYPHLIWTHYDRITFESVEKMEDYFILSDVRDNWVGSIQSMHLYKNETDSVFNYLNSENSFVHVESIKKPQEQPAFFCITSFKLDNYLKNLLELESEDGAAPIYSIVKKHISKALEPVLTARSIYYEIYNSLGAEDFVIVFLADSLLDFAVAVETLRNLKYETKIFDNGKTLEVSRKVFGTSYSFVGQNNLNKICDPKLDAHISLTFKSDKDYNEYIRELKESNLSITDESFSFGEYDFCFKIKSSVDLIKEYTKDGILTAENKFYKEYVFQSYTTWLYTIDALSIDNQKQPVMRIYPSDCEKIASISTTKIDFNNDINLFQELISHKEISKIPHFKEECRILMAEYRRYMNSSFLEQWWVDIEQQFKSLTASMSYFLNADDNVIDGKLSAIEESIEDIKETYMHITQASRMFFGTSDVTRYYNGSYNNIIRAYYGLIKNLISIGYSIPQDKGTEQPNLSFAISFDMNPKINSKLHLLTAENSEDKLISFNLPYGALYSMPKYLVYLVHEVFHYISPINRTLRNMLIFKVCTDLLLRHMTQAFFMKLVEDEISSSIIIKDLISDDFSDIIHSVVENATKDSEIKRIFSLPSEYFAFELQKFYIGQEVHHKINIVHLLTEVINLSLETFKNDTCYKKLLKKYISIYDSDKYELAGIVFEEIEKFANIDKKDLCLKISTQTNDIALSFINEIKGESFSGNIQEICEGLSEAVCDLYIINLLGLSFSEYIESIMILFDEMSYLKNLLNPTYKNDSMLFRIGLLVNVYSTDSNSKKWLAEELETWKKNTDILQKEEISLKIEEYYNNFLRCYGSYINMFVKYLNNMDLSILSNKIHDVYGDKTHEEWLLKISAIRGFYTKYKNIKSEKSKEKLLLDLNLEMVEHYQYQVPIHQQERNLKNKTKLKNISFSKNKYKTTSKIEVVVSSLSQYINEITKSINRLNKAAQDSGISKDGNYNTKMWFRGVCNYTYLSIPSIHRNVPNNISLYAYQTALLKETHARLVAYPELFKRQITETIEQIACMQHYGVPTNLMDFSTDFMTALHFALNPDREEDRKNIIDAAVFVVHPVLFNRAMIEMGQDEHLKKHINTFYPINCASLLGKELSGYIPDKCSDKYLADVQEDFNNKKTTFNPDKEAFKLPMAIIVPQTNDRIKSQFGTFIAYSLDYFPDEKNRTSYEYISLEKLQERYLKKYPTRKPFMEKIIISSGCLSELRQQLVDLGITQAKMYPELNNLLSSASNTVLQLIEK